MTNLVDREQEWLAHEVTPGEIVDGVRHGSPDAYANHGCRCAACREGKRRSSAVYRERNRERFRAQRRAEYAANPERFKEATRRGVLRRQLILDRYKLFVGCMKCGFRLHPAALQFHHRDPSTKSFNVSMSISRAWSLVKAEVRKCDVLCANCHAITHCVRSSRGRHAA